MAQILNSDRAVFGVLVAALAVALLSLAWARFEESSLGGRFYMWRANRRTDKRRRRRARGH